jgi:hypothetical protein
LGGGERSMNEKSREKISDYTEKKIRIKDHVNMKDNFMKRDSDQ